MKITRRQIRRIIKEELSRVNESYSSGPPDDLLAQALEDFPDKTRSDLVFRLWGFDRAGDPASCAAGTDLAGCTWNLRLDGVEYTYVYRLGRWKKKLGSKDLPQSPSYPG
jgi:hypothetical protein